MSPENRERISSVLMPMLNDPVKQIYTPANHNEARDMLIVAGVDGDLDALIAEFSGGDAYALHVMQRAVAKREQQAKEI